MLLYVYKIVRLVLLAVFITYFIGCTWWGLCNNFDKDGEMSFKKFNAAYFNDRKGNEDEMKILVICMYYALATLSTVGYGDYYPISNVERILAVIIMLGGVAFFSYIMGNFIEIISNSGAKMGVIDKSAELHNWLMLLQRFYKD